LAVHDLALRAEALFGSPQDVEWTLAEGRLHVLQSRPITTPSESSPREPPPFEPTVQARQLVGQPAGKGIGRGVARVVQSREDLLAFEKGEILVCDTIDPNMTFIVPLAGGIVERRGGMLIHGAIVAREHGIACVTGVPDATRWILTGDALTVDGYLGMVVVRARGMQGAAA
jgi:pyruvate,water dikinase